MSSATGSGNRPAPTARTLRAPGKLMLAGEYSVLGPSGMGLAMAVEPGMEAEVTPGDRWLLRRAESGVTWAAGDTDVPDDLRFAHAALTCALDELESGDAPPVRPHQIITRILGETGTGVDKPGVGGSASAAAAVVGAVFLAAGRELSEDRERLLSVALRAHLQAQGGRGSGYDVATIVHGGLVCWRSLDASGSSTAPVWERYRALPLRWPTEIALLAGYSGQSASTTGFLHKVEALGTEALTSDFEALRRPVQELVALLQQGALQPILGGLRACHDALVAWDRTRQLGIVTDDIRRMIRLASELGVVAKVSGAGGGDSVLAFSPDLERLGAVADRWRAGGYLPFVVPLDLAGVREVPMGGPAVHPS